MLLNGQVVQALLNEQADDAVGVEDEVGAVRVLVADDAVERKDISVDFDWNGLAKTSGRACNVREKRDQLRRLR